jgi:hypothetical protein
MTTNGSQQGPQARIRNAAEEATDAAKHRVRSAMEHGKNSAAAAAGDTAEVLGQAADRLSMNEQDTLSGAVDAMSARLSHFAKYVESHSLDELLRDATRLAHRHPAGVLLGGVCIGVALSRFFKASASRNDESASTDHPDLNDHSHRSGDHEAVHH